MHFTTITSLLATIALAGNAVMATPVPAASPEGEATTTTVEARAEAPLIDLWDEAGFLGLKFTGSANVGDCKNLPSKFNDLSSSGKAKAGFRCTVWVAKDCKGDGFSFNTSGSNSKQFPSWIDNKSSSWKCVKDE
ncbi:hypothetical protein B0H66DRAFT_595487 [Apodospora peruviana]|uniref:Uncharacterized protein n=1 Tax=Apodospora peruviana TaxID=516989 RepID=A0AAE0LZW1_9PEZI|nr:hypothetical protein B0H66DRAFT_595487 [Apodospora peruviana]